MNIPRSLAKNSFHIHFMLGIQKSKANLGGIQQLRGQKFDIF